MSVFDHPEFDDHESITWFSDSDTGLRAIVAIHSTVLGPAGGGVRRWAYASDAEALTDALRLSRGMTYKSAVAGVRFGGGKGVILASEDAPKSPELMAAFGRAVEALGGRYVTAEDVGMTVEDMRLVREQTAYVSGLPPVEQSAGGDPGPWTAMGVFLGLKAAVAFARGSDDLKGLRVAVQGVGSVGMQLCRYLNEAGAELQVADVNARNLDRARSELPVTVVSPDDILYTDADVLAPCALGNILDADSIPRIRAGVIAGAANNQLSTEDDGRLLTERGILYAPDYVINAGGIISCGLEYHGGASEADLREAIHRIPERLTKIFEESRSGGRPTSEVADAWARRIVAEGAGA
ncbi:Leu/Phe/Val dehydrogenase [Elongatibacter sediminis]|uniref:Glu/Leu/Phe/Val dehydrogenase dimerization domain-containing protein n=1 Tax=Elongatibacter sediminis TaxID=3119006 RepID=A0AAW9REA0_9GAMM